MACLIGPDNPNWQGGKRSHPLYTAYHGMLHRCRNPNDRFFDYYGGRGITVCQRWADDFWAFVEDMGERPDGTTLDRIDNDGDYEPGNCRWATPEVQRINRRPRAVASHCPKGHEFTSENTRIRGNGRRACCECARDYQRRYVSRQRAARIAAEYQARTAS